MSSPDLGLVLFVIKVGLDLLAELFDDAFVPFNSSISLYHLCDESEALDTFHVLHTESAVLESVLRVLNYFREFVDSFKTRVLLASVFLVERFVKRLEEALVGFSESLPASSGLEPSTFVRGLHLGLAVLGEAVLIRLANVNRLAVLLISEQHGEQVCFASRRIAEHLHELLSLLTSAVLRQNVPGVKALLGLVQGLSS